MLCNRNGLAKVSATPGKTITMNHFLINNHWYLVDLPGYGYAKRSKTLRASWEEAMMEYFNGRENLMTVFVLVDSRIPPQDVDMELINYLGENQIPVSIVYTKTDKNGRSTNAKNIAAIEKKMSEFWEELPTRFITSAADKTGREALLKFIEKAAKTFGKH
jgi:GTP-binding protein